MTLNPQKTGTALYSNKNIGAVVIYCHLYTQTIHMFRSVGLFGFRPSRLLDRCLKLGHSKCPNFGIIPILDVLISDIQCTYWKSWFRFQTEWRHPNDGSVEKGAKFNSNVESILNVAFNTSDRVLEMLADYSTDLEEILDKKGGKDCKATNTPTFTK